MDSLRLLDRRDAAAGPGAAGGPVARRPGPTRTASDSWSASAPSRSAWAGVVYHLESQFFSQWTIRSLVYTAPFAAPLAYAGLGFLLLVNRMVPRETDEWDWWVVFFALGGFLGVFVLALCDHAQNGFFHASEWWPVAASALAAGFLSVALVDRRGAFPIICFGVLALQAVVGLLGFYFHVAADVNGLSASLFENFVHGAPPFAPLLFVDLGVLAAIGLSAAAAGYPGRGGPS